MKFEGILSMVNFWPTRHLKDIPESDRREAKIRLFRGGMIGILQPHRADFDDITGFQSDGLRDRFLIDFWFG